MLFIIIGEPGLYKFCNLNSIPFLNVLKKKDYSGWLVVEAEQDPAKANPFEYAKIGFNYLSKTAKQCGFKIIN